MLCACKHNTIKAANDPSTTQSGPKEHSRKPQLTMLTLQIKELSFFFFFLLSFYFIIFKFFFV